MRSLAYRSALILLALIVGVGPAFAKTSSIARDPSAQSETETAIAPYELNTSLGTTMFHGFAIASGGQFGFALFSGRAIYIGPEVAFSFFSPGSVLGVLGAAWIELPMPKSSKISFALGLAGGAGFSEGLSTLSATSSMLLGETTLIEELDDLVSLREQIRPGLFGGIFALQINLALSFHFY